MLYAGCTLAVQLFFLPVRVWILGKWTVFGYHLRYNLIVKPVTALTAEDKSQWEFSIEFFQ